MAGCYTVKVSWSCDPGHAIFAVTTDASTVTTADDVTVRYPRVSNRNV